MYFIFEGGGWVIHYALPSDSIETHSVVETEALALSEKTIHRDLDSIACHAVPSF